MASEWKRLNELSIEHKKEVWNLIDKGVNQLTNAVQSGVAKSTVGNINKNRDVILKAWQENCSNERKQKLRKTDNEFFNILTLKCFQKCCAVGIAVTGSMFQKQVKEIAQRLQVENFQTRNGWLELFRTRCNINV
jgi:hypothetical protein